jgi:hypothetical protein
MMFNSLDISSFGCVTDELPSSFDKRLRTSGPLVNQQAVLGTLIALLSEASAQEQSKEFLEWFQ